MLDPTKLYKVSQLVEEDRLFEKKGKFWILSKIRSGALKAVNTSDLGKRPFYLIEGSDALEFLKKY